MYDFLLSYYPLPIWSLIIIFILLLILFIKIFINLKKASKLDYLTYKEDSIYKAKGTWNWEKNSITNIQCYCPTCDSVLVYDDRSCHTKATELTKTDFICETCNSQIVSTIHGGNKNYAINLVKREIERRIRTEEYKEKNS